MTFSEFANILYPFCGNGDKTATFVVTLTDNIMEVPQNPKDEKKAINGEYNPISELEESTQKQLFSGKRKLSQKNASIILGHLDKGKFEDYINEFAPDTLNSLCDKLGELGVKETSLTVGKWCADIFEQVIKSYTQKKSAALTTLINVSDLTKVELSSELAPHPSDWGLVLEVGGECPKCGTKLSTDKNGKSIPRYKTIIINQNISADLSKNRIAVCPKCYDEYIFDTSNEDIALLVELKRGFVNMVRSREALSANKIPIEIQIEEVLKAIEITPETSLKQISGDKAFEVERKVTENIVLMRKIRENALNYFDCVETLLKAGDRIKSQKFRLFQSKLITCYEEVRFTEFSQEAIYWHLVDWLYKQAKHQHKAACEIIIAFFVQLCDVFEPESEDVECAITE